MTFWRACQQLAGAGGVARRVGQAARRHPLTGQHLGRGVSTTASRAVTAADNTTKK